MCWYKSFIKLDKCPPKYYGNIYDQKCYPFNRLCILCTGPSIFECIGCEKLNTDLLIDI